VRYKGVEARGASTGVPAGAETRRSGAGVIRPDEAALRLIVHLRIGKEECILQGGEVIIIELELELKGPIRHAPPALEHGYRLVEDLLKGHRPPS